MPLFAICDYVGIPWNRLIKEWILLEIVSRNFPYPILQSMEITERQCENYGDSLSNFLKKNFVKATVLLKKLLNSWFDESFSRWG